MAKSSKMETQPWRNQNSKRSGSTTKPRTAKPKATSNASQFGVCRNCLNERAIHLYGTCQFCWRGMSHGVRALVKEAYKQESTAGHGLARAGIAVGPDAPDSLFKDMPDKPEMLIDPEPTFWERFFGGGARR